LETTTTRSKPLLKELLMLRLTLLFLILVAGGIPVVAQSVNEETAVRDTVNHYLHGLKKSKYTDYLSLLKFGDEWRIVNKIHVAEPMK
jgi:Putative lumazine-binding